MIMSHYDLETKCLHSGYTPKKGEPCALPIYQSTTFKYDTTDEMGQLFDLKAEGYFYTRLQNPTNDAVAAKIADLEGGVAGLLTLLDRLQTSMRSLISVRLEIMLLQLLRSMVEHLTFWVLH